MKLTPVAFLVIAIILFITGGNLAYTADMTGCGFAIAGGLSVHAAAILASRVAPSSRD